MSKNKIETKNTLGSEVGLRLHNTITEIGKKLEGKLLTLVDASTADPEQRKALKDVVREVLSDHYYSTLYSTLIDVSCEIDRITGEEVDYGLFAQTLGTRGFYLDENSLGYKYTRSDK